MAPEPLIVAGLVSLVAGYYVTRLVRRRLRAAAWETVAFELDLTDAGEFHLEGTLYGVEVRAHAFMRAGDHDEWYTRYEAEVDARHLPAGLTMRREGLLDLAVDALGGEDVKTGIEEVDRKLRIGAESRAEVADWAAQPHIEDALKKMVKGVNDFELVDGKLVATTFSIAPQKWLKSGLMRAARVAAAFSQPTGDLTQ